MILTLDHEAWKFLKSSVFPVTFDYSYDQKLHLWPYLVNSWPINSCDLEEFWIINVHALCMWVDLWLQRCIFSYAMPWVFMAKRQHGMGSPAWCSQWFPEVMSKCYSKIRCSQNVVMDGQVHDFDHFGQRHQNWGWRACQEIKNSNYKGLNIFKLTWGLKVLKVQKELKPGLCCHSFASKTILILSSSYCIPLNYSIFYV